jgi:hypothetical protein
MLEKRPLERVIPAEENIRSANGLAELSKAGG